jgi:hypothetical protein
MCNLRMLMQRLNAEYVWPVTYGRGQACKVLCKLCSLCAKYPSTLLPQGRIEAPDRVLNMVSQMDAEGLVTVQIQGLVSRMS